MKYLKYILLLLLLIPTIVLAKVNVVEVTSIELEEKSPNVEIIDETVIEGSNLSFNNKFYEVNDYIKYKVVIKNTSGEDIDIVKTKDSIQTKYFLYDVNMGSIKKIKKNEEKDLILIVKYNTKVNREDVVSGKYVETQKIHIGIVNGELVISDKEITDKPVNPLTHDIIITLLLIFILSGILYFVFKKKRMAKYNLFLILLIPVYINAVNTIEVTSSIEVKLVKPNPCTYEGELIRGTEYVNGQYTYRYGQDYSYSSWSDYDDADGWGVVLTDKDSTEPVTTKLCTSINDKPIVSMNSMFSNSKAESIDLSSFDTSNVMTMQNMFGNATSLTELDLTTFDTNNVTNMIQMFENLTGLTELDLHGFETPNLTIIYRMFYGSSNLTELDLSSFDLSKVSYMSETFVNMNSLEKLSIRGTTINGAGSMFRYSFANTPIKELDFEGTKIKGTCGYLFSYLPTLETINLKNIDTSEIEDMGGMFYDDVLLKNIDLTGMDTSKVKNMTYMFGNNKSLEEIDVSGFDTSSLMSFSYMFSDTGLKKLDLSGWDVSNVRSVWGIMIGSTEIEELDLTGWDLSNLGQYNMMGRMFGGSSYAFSGGDYGDIYKLKKINLTNAILPGDIGIFQFMPNVEEIILDNVDTSNMTTMRDMFSGDKKLKSLNLSSFDTSNVTAMDGMFANTNSLTELDLSSFDTSNVTDMHSMFESASALESVDLSSFDTSNVTNMWRMFAYTPQLTEVDISSFNFDSLSNTNAVSGITGFFESSGATKVYVKTQEIADYLRSYIPETTVIEVKE